MTDQNDAAQPGENLLDYAMAIARERELDVTGHKHDSDGAVRRFKAAVERALLSKLRAEGVQAGDERAALTRQDIFDRFQFLEGLVTEHRYTQIAETAIAIYESGAPWASMADTIRELRAELGYVAQYGKRVLPDMCPPATSRDRWMYEQGRLAERAALASAPVAPAEVMEALHNVDDFIARCDGNDRGSCESVNVLRRALSAPVADAGLPDVLPEYINEGGAQFVSMATVQTILRAARAALASAPAASEAVRLLRKIREDDFLSDTQRHRIDRLLASAPNSTDTENGIRWQAGAWDLTLTEVMVDGRRWYRDDDPKVLARAPVAGEAKPVCWIEKDVLESVRDEGSDAWVYWRPADHVAEHDEMPLYAAPQASEAVRNEALYLLREARALLPMFTAAEAIGDWSEKVNRFAAGGVIDVPPQADKGGGDCAKGAHKGGSDA
ncbi:hypothetical protein [Achromobacter marplatensis]|uniref:hypothetical protein n=1 Tax=Achromobacter marplatensis TaxID=470868 RepID=UPI0028E36F7D|nr:hypothetical protein [Achromobacter marplatensis]